VHNFYLVGISARYATNGPLYYWDYNSPFYFPTSEQNQRGVSCTIHDSGFLKRFTIATGQGSHHDSSGEQWGYNWRKVNVQVG